MCVNVAGAKQNVQQKWIESWCKLCFGCWNAY